MQKSKRNKTLKKWILLSIITIVFLQAAIIIGVILMSRTPARLDSSSVQSLVNMVDTRGEALQKKITSWTDMTTLQTGVESMFQYEAQKKRMSISEFMKDKENRKQALNSITSVVLNALRDSESTCSYVILENPEGRNKKEALILRDLNPQDNPSNNSDILVEAGSSDMLFNQGFTLDSFWSEQLPVDEESAFYQIPMNAGSKYPDYKAEDLGYYSGVSRFRDKDLEHITYSIPLLDENHRSYGVIGFAVTCDYMKKQMPSNELAPDSAASYSLGILNSENQLEIVLTENSFFQALLPGKARFNLQKLATNDKLFNIITGDDKEHLVAGLHSMRLYNTNTPFVGEQWVLCGVIDSDTLYRSSSQLFFAMLIAVLISLGISIVGAIWLTERFTKPIHTLLVGVEEMEAGAGKLPQTDIVEFDELAETIEKKNRLIYKAGSKVADILDIADMNLGVVEYSAESDMVFCTRQVLNILHEVCPGWNNNYVSRKNFTELYERVRGHFTKAEGEKGIFYYTRENINPVWISVKRVGSRENGICVVQDVTENMHEKAKILHDRDFDVLTNLHNRRAFAREIKKLVDDGGCTNGILTIWDLDHLKYTNDTYGHDMGDKYICMMGQILRNHSFANAISARLSGDEFVLFVYGEAEVDLIEQVKQLHESMQHTKMILPDGTSLNMSASGGMARYSQDGATYAELIKYADFAMYENKKTAKGTIKLFDHDTFVRDYILVQGIGELSRILSEESIRYAFQPIVSVKDYKVFAYEALMRPISDILKSPSDVLRLAESQSAMGKVERMTWFHALGAFAKMRQKGSHQKLFVNSMPDQFMSEDSLHELEDKYHDLLPDVVMETTEGSKLDARIEEQKQRWCKRWNIENALDDYGTGYSNTDILVSHSYQYLKLDRSLVKDIHLSSSTQALVEGMIAYGHANGSKVIAEGVELKEELDVLVGLGIDYGQGYYFAKPGFSLYTKG
ncbi:MAG: bifunctional diguanylate cyclase/phosphodiesterase [Lachnospiraceae bacterium]|nr:bifunctional diguanylate cyclase/phosphodiesterase [Lachnospiraceae bacterium]